jgi:hypothetical protein
MKKIAYYFLYYKGVIKMRKIIRIENVNILLKSFSKIRRARKYIAFNQTAAANWLLHKLPCQ